MPDNKNLLNFDDLADVFAQLNDIEDAPEELTEEEKASQRRYEEIIINYICLFNYLFISSQMSAKPYFIGSTGILLLW